MNVKDQDAAIKAWRERADESLSSIKREIIESEAQLRSELEAARSVPADLTSFAKADHVLVGVGRLIGWHGTDAHRISVRLDENARIELGEIKLVEDGRQNNSERLGRYRAVLMLFREGGE